MINLHSHGSYNLEKVLNVISHLGKSLNLVKVLEQYLISLLGFEKSLNFSAFLFLFFFFFMSNAISVLQIQLQVIPSDHCHFAKFCYGKQYENNIVNGSTKAEKVKITNDSTECFSQSKVFKRGSKKAELMKKSQTLKAVICP